MLSIHDIKAIIEEYRHSPSVAAERIHHAIEHSLITLNPVNQLTQTPFQVKSERDSLLFSQRALLLKIERLKKTNKNYRLTIERLRAKLSKLDHDAMVMAQNEYNKLMSREINK